MGGGPLVPTSIGRNLFGRYNDFAEGTVQGARFDVVRSGHLSVEISSSIRPAISVGVLSVADSDAVRIAYAVQRRVYVRLVGRVVSQLDFVPFASGQIDLDPVAVTISADLVFVTTANLNLSGCSRARWNLIVGQLCKTQNPKALADGGTPIQCSEYRSLSLGNTIRACSRRKLATRSSWWFEVSHCHRSRRS